MSRYVAESLLKRRTPKPLRALEIHLGLICSLPALLALCEAPDRSVLLKVQNVAAAVPKRLPIPLTNATSIHGGAVEVDRVADVSIIPVQVSEK